MIQLEGQSLPIKLNIMILKRVVFLYFLLGLIFTFSGVLLVRAQVTEDIDSRRARLQAELEAEERAIAEQTKLLQAKQRETGTIQGEVDLLRSQIRQAQTRINAKKVQITRLEDDILNRESNIVTLEEKINKEKGSLAELLRKSRDVESSSFVEIILDNNSLTGFFSDLDSFALVQRSMHDLLEEIRDSQEQSRQEKLILEQKKSNELDAQKIIEEERLRIAKNESAKNTLLNISKSQEQSYQAVLAARQKRAAEIRAALFALRDTAAIPFGQALEFANQAQRLTGVRPAFLLAIIQQESNLGANVGSCVITDLKTGQTRGINSGQVFNNGIHPTRDLPLLQTILPQLGRDPLVTPVSCPMSVGYGGAMGPAQFIPSTWNMMKASIASALGVAVPDPWNPHHALIASAMLLRDNGAAGGGYTAEINAACRYFSGRTCATGPGSSYGNQVMARAQNIQLNMIEPLLNTQ